MLILVQTDWCPICRRFVADVLPSPALAGLSPRMVKLTINPERSPQEQQLSKRLGVTGYPKTFLLPPGDRPPVELPAHVDPEHFALHCREALDSLEPHHPDRVREARAAGDVQAEVLALKARMAEEGQVRPELLDRLGELALDQGCFERSAVLFGAVITLDPTFSKGRAYYMRAVAHGRRGDPHTALADARRACELGSPQGCRAIEKLERMGSTAQIQ
jgi:hypothetical protein